MRLRKRLPLLLLACATLAWAASPAFAQRRPAQRHPAQPRSGTAVARPPSSRPQGRSSYRQAYRPAYRPYYRTYSRGYYRPYSYWPYYWPYSYFGASLGWGYPGYYPAYGYYGYSGYAGNYGYSGYAGNYGYSGYARNYGYYGYAGWGQGAGIKFKVEPKSAEVYVDGYYAGIVDSFDGIFQKLNLQPGAHEIVLYQNGFHSVTQTLYLDVGSTFKLEAALDSRPTPPRGDTVSAEPYEVTAGEPGEAMRESPMREAPTRQTPMENPAVQVQDEYGTLAIRVQPGDAEILVDSEPWHGAAGMDRLVIQLGAGSHRVVVQKDGYETYSAEVQVRRGETTRLNVSILKRESGGGGFQ